jgi:D-alanyl-D-alanine carboxypeptidase/D-alanyl-D-alanine-endopeptidase (penicillin-binding protein 4)
MTRAQLSIIARLLAVVVAAAVAFTVAWFSTDAARGGDTATGPEFPRAYQAAAGTPTPAPTPSDVPAATPSLVAGTLAKAMSAAALGPHVLAKVVDVASGQVLFDQGATSTTAPASTAKLLTAAAVLAVRRVTDRITTKVAAGAGGRIVLVGGGDPTLSGATRGSPPLYPGAARISDLADQLRKAGTHVTGIVVDDSLFSGPSVSPAWAPEDVPSEYAGAITAVMTDGARAAPGDYGRSATPDLAAGHELAAALGAPGLPVSRGAAPAGAQLLASVSSAPIGTLVEQMLQDSDNVIAECLARQVAIAEHQPASFLGAAAAIRSVLRRLGSDPGGGMVDASGLAAKDRLSPAVLVGVLRLIAGPADPALHTIVSAMPVAGWSGTLEDRYIYPNSRLGAGVVRAKTGTLTGDSTLAGLVHDKSGQLLAFAFMADRVPSTYDADRALDALATRLAACGCS